MRSKLFVFILLAALLCGNVGTASAVSEGPQGQPDLVIQVEFDGTYINIRVRNVGTGYAGGFRSYLYIDPQQQPPQLGTPDTSSSFLFGLAAGQSYTWSYGPWTPTPGQHVLWAWVDRDDQVDEVDDLNNFGFFLINDPTPTPTPTATPGPTHPMFLPLIMRGYLGNIVIPGEPTPTPTPPILITPDSRMIISATATPTATPTP